MLTRLAVRTPLRVATFHSGDLGAQGEWRVAMGRMWITGVLAVLSIAVLVGNPGVEQRWGTALSLASAAIAAGILLVARRATRPRHFAWFTCVYDVSIVTLLLATDLMRDMPSVAVNGRVTFSAYFLALAGTIVRADRRVCLGAGLVAAVQYLGIAAWSAASWPATPTPDTIAFGYFDWAVQVERAVTLALFAGMCGSIAAWALQLRANATHDALTGVYNRRVLEDRLADEMLRARRANRALSVAMIDVDHFKSVNDRHGHHVGDEALRAVAHTLASGLRRTDILARWGGEEFAVVFPETPECDAVQKLEAMRAAIGQHPLITAGGIEVRLTISAGVAALGQATDTPLALLQKADQRLMEAKRTGRNRVHTMELAAIPG